jgi:hypothetical protein
MLGMLHALKDLYASENVEIGKFHYRPTLLVPSVDNGFRRYDGGVLCRRRCGASG